MDPGDGQFCTVARGALVLCERWTPLVVRELLLGRRCFDDLHRGTQLNVPASRRAALRKNLLTLHTWPGGS